MNKPFPHSPEGAGNYVSHLDKLAVTSTVYSKAVLPTYPKQMREFEEKKHSRLTQRTVFRGRNSSVNSKEGKASIPTRNKEKELSWKGGRGG